MPQAVCGLLLQAGARILTKPPADRWWCRAKTGDSEFGFRP